jgi:hypothetical protein
MRCFFRNYATRSASRDRSLGAVLAALVRMGFVASPDGGRTFIMRRAA